MLSKILTTPIDDLVEIVKNNSEISISSLREKMKLPVDILEMWITILEEARVLRIQYRGLEGYVSYLNEDSKKEKIENKKIDVDNLKEIFLKKTKLKNLSNEKIANLWISFIEEYDSEIKDLFVDKAKKMGYNNEKISRAWIKYKEDLQIL